MPAQPQQLVLHVVPFSHPCLAVSAALDRIGREYETVELVTGKHGEEVEGIYGEGRRTVPGLLVDEEPVHGTAAIFARLAELHPEAGLYPEAHAEAIREAEAGISQDLQMSARVLVFGALYFRPESMATFAGAGQLDPPGVDFAIKSMRATWRYLEISAVRVHATLQELPAQLDAVEALIEAGAAGGEQPTALDFQLGSSLRLLAEIGDVRPLIDASPAAAIAAAWFDRGKGDVPAGAFPPGWVPAASS
ncbi:MAG TPA: glutathione S-transferase N-terminal domain-containing protein [Solirubrobacterales bacterium]|nr:glutathione S-transferase N-terminal domain-containing protein [Solirubrobacterales bacterium]